MRFKKGVLPQYDQTSVVTSLPLTGRKKWVHYFVEWLLTWLTSAELQKFKALYSFFTLACIEDEFHLHWWHKYCGLWFTFIKFLSCKQKGRETQRALQYKLFESPFGTRGKSLKIQKIHVLCHCCSYIPIMESCRSFACLSDRWEQSSRE